MKTTSVFRASVLTLALAVTAAAHAADVAKYDPSKIKTPPINKIPSVKPERFVMPNGAVVYLLENHELPVVTGTVYFKSSPSLTPADKVGLGGLTGEVMRSGGTATRSGDWLDDRLAAIGASVSTGLGGETGSGGFRCLTENTAEVVGLWADVLRRPAFPDDKIELAKVGMRRSIASRNDEMFPILQRTASEATFGADSPWARKPEYATVEAITQADCRKLHAQVFVPERAIFAIYGDFNSAAMKKQLLASFGDWKKSGTPAPTIPPVPASTKPRLVFAPKNDVTQSGIVLTQMGFRADDPDYAPMQVLEQGLGGGFSSRLFSTIRTRRGLAYATGAVSGADFTKPGVFLAYSLTKSESTMVALDLLREEVARVTREPLGNDELEVAKQAVVNGFVFNFADPSQTLFRAAYYELIGYPADFLDRYQKALDQVTAQSVLEAAKRRIRPAEQVAIVVGKEADFDRKLETAGLPVERVDVTIPPPPSKMTGVASSPEALAKGKAMLAKASQLAGGAAAWSAVKNVTVQQSATLSIQGQTMSMEMSETWVFPDRRVTSQKLPFGEVKQGYDGKVGWMSAMGQVQDQPKMASSVAEDWTRSLYQVLGKPDQFEVTALAEPRTVGEQTYTAAFVKSDAVRDWVLLFAPDGKLAGMEYQGEGPAGMTKVTELYADWQPEGALQYPRSSKALMDGKPFMEAKVGSVKLNDTVSDAVFAKPAK